MAANGLLHTVGQRRFYGWLGSNFSFTRTFLLYGAILVFIIVESQPYSQATHLQTENDTKNQNVTGICQSVDIRNSFPQNDTLKGCRVVEGFVQILLLDNVNETDLATRSYPELTEITDYLLLFRVNGLRSIGQLFPNLAVIRGQTTFFSHYALIIFEMSSLQEIGLYSLTDITNGLIRIDKNPSLCFVNTIDWDRIAHEKGEHFIRSSKPENECAVCSGNESGKEAGVTISCPKAPKTNSEDRDKYLCWNRQHCQKICPNNCTSCNDKGECCNELCLGGCSNDDINACKVCRNFSMGIGDDRQCMFNCPKNYYKFLGRRCVTFEECIGTRKPMESTDQNIDVEYPYKVFEDKCVLQCPTNYMNDYDNHTCKPCAGKCKKECPGVNVDSISSAQQLRGCTHITGSLEIQIRGGRNVVNELEENLSMIEEIAGYLKVVRSFPLVSLNFLKSLKRIGGKYLDSQKYVFILLDNQNIQDIWDWENRTLEIQNKNGLLFFHFNPKLCLSKIRKLQKMANLKPFTEQEVASNSNGDKIACNVKNLEVSVVEIHNKIVLLEWQQFKIDDHRKLLGYIVYSIEATHKNITLYDGRDACGEDNWRVDDVAIPDENTTTLRHPLTQLKPYTQYAFYVKTYTIASESMGAQSKINYFRTSPGSPTVPQSLRISSNASNALLITWLPPLHPNGNLTHYIITGKKLVDTYADSQERDYYCEQLPASTPKQQINHPITTTYFPMSNNNNNNTQSCSCDDNKQSRKSFDESIEIEINRIKFEDELQNQVYVKREEIKSRKKRETASQFPDKTENSLLKNKNNEIVNITENGTDIWESFSFTVYGKTEFYITNLHHYTSYEINVQACREKESQEEEEGNCSNTIMTTQRTQSKVGVDNISRVQITNESLDSVTVSWEQPKDPNGRILSVSVEYKQVDIENAITLHRCIITSKDLTNGTMSYVLDKLTPGNYSLRLLPKSAAGVGQYTSYVYFYIKESSSSTLLVDILVPVILVILGAGFAAYVYWKHKKEKETMRLLIPTINPEYVPSVYVPDEWEVPRKKIELIKELGQGSFGMVYEGIARDIKGKSQIRCAIKTVNEHATNRERLEFLNEASVMKAFDTAHVVRLLGVVSQGQPTLVIMELMANGDLKSYLRSHRPDADTYDPSSIKHPPTLKQIYKMAIEIADGMAYLSAKKFVHRDLAARNCMVAEDLTVKIGDFGMTRDIYETDYYRKGSKGLLPVRWMAPESLKDGVFTSSSDVWSYGVVLWEMATLASQPYQGLSNDQVLRYVIDGGVMERPENCPDKLYTLMRYCWQHKPTARPTFLKLCSLMLDDASPSFAQVSFYHSAAGIEARTQRPTPSPSQDQDEQTTPLRKAGLGYTSSDSQESDTEIDIDTNTHIQFPSISEDRDIVTATANGYVSGCTTNGAATTQC